MKTILLLSDNHSYIEDDVLEHAVGVDEIWNAGDIGDPIVLDKLEAIAPVKAVYGNIDTQEIRDRIPLNQIFDCEGVKVMITHIGGYPGRYNKRVYAMIKQTQPDLYICGHSHICKVMRDSSNNLIHMNPGACGNHGFHKFRTMLKFDIKKGKIENLVVIELGKRGAIEKATYGEAY